jgi:hypothetical protein
MADEPGAAAAADALIRLAVAYSAAVDRVTHDGGASIDELMALSTAVKLQRWGPPPAAFLRPKQAHRLGEWLTARLAASGR